VHQTGQRATLEIAPTPPQRMISPSLITTLTLVAVSSSVAAPPPLKVGDQAPDFSATSHTGETVSLKDYAGKKLLLWFYPRAGTGG